MLRVIQPQSDLTDFNSIPADVLRQLGLFSGASSMAALSTTCHQMHHALGVTEHNQARSVDLPHEIAEFVHHASRGHEYEVGETLKAAGEGRTRATVEQLLSTPSIISDSKKRIMNGIKPLQYALWSLDKHMFNRLQANMTASEIASQVYEMVADQAPEFVAEFGTVISLDAMFASWNEFNNFAETINWNHFQSNSEEDVKLQALFASVITEQSELPTHFINEHLHPTRSFLVRGNVPEFNEKALARLTALSDGTSCNALAPNSKFGVEYGVLRNHAKAIRANKEDAAKHARTFYQNPTGKISLTRINANGLKKLYDVRLSWHRDVVAQACELINKPRKHTA